MTKEQRERVEYELNYRLQISDKWEMRAEKHKASGDLERAEKCDIHAHMDASKLAGMIELLQILGFSAKCDPDGKFVVLDISQK